MTAREGFPPGVPCWIDTTQPDPEAAVRFYSQLFGWSLEDRLPAEVPGQYFIGRLEDGDVAAVSGPDGPAVEVATWNTYIGVADVEEAAARVVDHGGRVLAGPIEVGEPGRMAVCTDPAGAELHLWQPGTRTGAEVVNADASWNWSNLHTNDPAGARAFYGGVFGWEADATSLDEQAVTMWRLPGYGRFLEAGRDPGIIERQADAGAPAGFEDAIGWMLPLGDDEPDGQNGPHWSVTFAVDDTDGTAKRADELGGEVLVPPQDAEWVRSAVLRDPQGAVFTINTFQPPG